MLSFWSLSFSKSNIGQQLLDRKKVLIIWYYKCFIRLTHRITAWDLLRLSNSRLRGLHSRGVSLSSRSHPKFCHLWNLHDTHRLLLPNIKKISMRTRNVYFLKFQLYNILILIYNNQYNIILTIKESLVLPCEASACRPSWEGQRVMHFYY